jgi:uncharacterized ferritin-like protein (DUF455 family)
MNSLEACNVFEKLSLIEESCHKAMMGWITNVPEKPGRDIQVLHMRLHPKKIGLSYTEGQARLLHDLANIELQAMELALRTLIEFQDAPKKFREELKDITLSEARHLALCLDAIEKMGFKWGHWPVHIALWEAVGEDDSLLDRILIVHRYLEGSGLDAGENILNRLHTIHAPEVVPVVETIMREEVDHVLFGSNWYREICKQLEINPEEDFPERLQKISLKVPRRLEKISTDLRKKAGFDDFELKILQDFQEVQRLGYSHLSK